MKKETRICILVWMLLAVLPFSAAAETEMNSFVGSSPSDMVQVEYSPAGNTTLVDEIGATDSLVYYFYRPTCKFCSERADMILAGLPDEITLPDGSKSCIRLVVLNKSDPVEGEIISRYYEEHDLPKERQLVPTLIIGDRYVCGSGEIKVEFLRLLLDGAGLYTPRIDGKARQIQ